MPPRSRVCTWLRAVALALAPLPLLAPTPARAGAAVTYDLHVHVYCDPPAGPDLCFAGSGWKTANDIRAAYQERVVPVLDRIYEPTGISFRLYAFDYDESRPAFAAVLRPSDLDPPTADDDAIRDMREIARLPANRGRIQVFALPRLEIGFSAVAPESACSGGADDLRRCNPTDTAACPGGTCESLPNYGVFIPVGTAGDPILLAREMAHHFCLGHTHTGADQGPQGGVCGAPVNHDGDGIADTPADPGPMERKKHSEYEAASDAERTEIAKQSDAIVPDALATCATRTTWTSTSSAATSGATGAGRPSASPRPSTICSASPSASSSAAPSATRRRPDPPQGSRSTSATRPPRRS